MQVVTFIGLVFLLRKMVLSSSSNEIKRLQRLNQENEEKARELAQRVEEARLEHGQKLRQVNEEVRKLKEGARLEAEQIKAGILEEAKKEKDFMIAQAMNSKEKIREEVMAQMQDVSKAQAFELIQKVISTKNQRRLHEGIIEDVFDELIEVSKDTFTQVAQVSSVEIKTTRILSKQHKEKLGEILLDKVGKDIFIKETADKEIIAGIIITMGSLIIDGSLKGRLEK